MSKILSNKSSVNLDYPICRPSLDLDFTQEELDPRITFTRGSIGTRVNRNRLIETVSANQPRFDYDPVTGECKGLLIEESRQNLYINSDDFSNASWSKFTCTISSNVTETTAPDGTNTADKLIPNIDQTSTGAYIIRTTSVTSGTSYTVSCFVKVAGYTTFAFVFQSTGWSTSRFARFNLSSGTLGTIDANVTASITPYGNGWYRCSATSTATATTTGGIQFRYSGKGDGTSGIYVWGAQVEAGAFPTSYIPTSASTVTRSADLASMTGTNFSSWYNQNEGTLYASAKSNANTTTIPGIAALNNGGASYRVDLRYYQGGNSATFFNGVPNGGSSLSRTSGFSLTNPKFVVSYATRYIIFCVNSSLVSSRTSEFVPSPLINTLRIGNFDSGQYHLNGTISRLTYYPRALKQNQLQYLTQ